MHEKCIQASETHVVTPNKDHLKTNRMTHIGNLHVDQLQ